MLLELAVLWPIISGKGIGGKQTRHASIINRKPRERRLLFHFFYNAFLLVVSPQKKVTMENFRITKGNWPVIGYYFPGLFFPFCNFSKKKFRKDQTIFSSLGKQAIFPSSVRWNKLWIGFQLIPSNEFSYFRVTSCQISHYGQLAKSCWNTSRIKIVLRPDFWLDDMTCNSLSTIYIVAKQPKWFNASVRFSVLHC